MKAHYLVAAISLLYSLAHARPYFKHREEILDFPIDFLKLHELSGGQHNAEGRPPEFTPTAENGVADGETAVNWGRRWSSIGENLGKTPSEEEHKTLKAAAETAKKTPNFENWAKLSELNGALMVKRLKALKEYYPREEEALVRKAIDEAVFIFENDATRIQTALKNFKEAKTDKERELPTLMFVAEFEYSSKNFERIQKNWKDAFKVLDEQIELKKKK